jgi:uncharacterized protein YdhG (YjbR/CyaY superfamily)
MIGGSAMEGNNASYTTTDEYISLFPPETQEVLQTIRKTIHEAAPAAQEKISWRMPTFYYLGNLVHFAAFKNHVGLYPGASGVEAFQEELREYKTSKGAIQFPYKKPLPLKLISKIVAYRLAENEAWAKEKAQKKGKA